LNLLIVRIEPCHIIIVLHQWTRTNKSLQGFTAQYYSTTWRQ